MRRPGAVLALALVAGCAYYNGMWSAERYAKSARHEERAGQDASARIDWAQASVKAESVLARHPKSRWADDALVLDAEGREGSGDCVTADSLARQAFDVTTDSALLERAHLVRAQCALAGDRPGLAAAEAGAVLHSRDRDRRSAAAYLAGLAALADGDPAGATALLGGSREPLAAPARVRALLAAGRDAAAEALADSLVRARIPESAWDTTLASMADAAGPDAASALAARVVPRLALPAGARARLLIADGDRLRASGADDSAAARYRAAARQAPDSAEGPLAELRLIELALDSVSDSASLAGVAAALDRAALTPAMSASEAAALARLAHEALVADSTPGGRFRRAELVRDSLRAPRFAARLFEAFARDEPQSLFAPKAILAALPLAPDRADSLRRILRADYAETPYALALDGRITPAYAAAEDSLGVLLGVRTAAPAAVLLPDVDAPLTGPRGPWLEDRAPAAASAAAPAGRERPKPPEARPRKEIN